ncbi:MAG TPA: fused MFS/spermidine synthase [Gemmatimonadaceae bacterium]|nr:fused MFS/spermidine synthase [Gemmatimonadaceae bacterium]
MLALFALTTLASAFLLFWIEPLFAKMVLPLLGGSPAVWNTCLMYFQGMLLLGYLYAHLTSRWLDARRQAWLHAALLVLAVLCLPVGVPAGWTPPASSTVVPWLIGLLTVAVGAPFMLLSATAPLVQRWLTSTDHSAAQNPYLLYAASNAGSLIGLLGFPFLMEPNLRLSQQASLWGIGFVVAIGLAVLCAFYVSRRSRAPIHATVAPLDDSSASPTIGDRIQWLALAFVPSSLLLGVTTYISTDVAAVPLLWVVPLALYLITFIIVFGRSGGEPGRAIGLLHAALLASVILVMFWGRGISLRTRILLHLAVFFTTALVLHGRLAAARPRPRYLTEFYLWMALGGALGGAFNAIAAPLLFKTIAEYQLVLIGGSFLRPSWRSHFRDMLGELRLTPVSVIPALLVGGVSWLGLADSSLPGISGRLLVSIIAAAVMILLSDDAVRFGASIVSIFLVSQLLLQRYEKDLFQARSFFGAYRVEKAYGPTHRLVHGTTTHGAQFQDSARRRIPVTYYHRNGPVGQAFAALSSRLDGRSIGAVGLGAGTVLCYSRRGQEWTFFEIDPLVRQISGNPRYFSYLGECEVRPRIVIGDARLTLAREPSGKFSVLIVDAFSSDAIPVHLLTREAFSVYRRVLDDHGVLMVHISNKHLNLKPVVAALAKDAGLLSLLGEHDPDPGEEAKDLDYPSDWVVLARRRDDFGALAADSSWTALTARPDFPVWNDDYSNIVRVIKW